MEAVLFQYPSNIVGGLLFVETEFGKTKNLVHHHLGHFGVVIYFLLDLSL